jgi:uncharacterized phage protein gp47/JayE
LLIRETFEDIIQEMLTAVPDSYDKRIGSIIYNALAPVALKIASKNIEINEIENQVYPDTATGRWLDRAAAEEGLVRKDARATRREAIFEPFIPVVGSRFFTSDGLFWKLINNNTVECETIGYIGNTTLIEDNLIPVEYINGLERAIIGEVKVFGANVESDDDFRIRLLDEYQNKKFNSNKAQIKAWAKEIQGVGDAKVISLWDGPNTVKVIIVDEEKFPAQQALVEEVQEYLDPIECTGEGEGMADIGTIVTVIPAVQMNVDISVKVKSLSEDIPRIRETFVSLLNDYRKQIVFVEDAIKYNYIGSLIIGIKGVEDYKDLKINGVTTNLDISNESVPVFRNIEVLPYE